ncbi:trimeric LpxA-like protein [Chytridium lagenaria]|nr:trimeric LpxA-like protein [Chytridium lagenaria]
MSGSIVCDEAELKGFITLGENNIIHPKCRIVSEGGGQIIIGKCNIIEENASIINWSPEPMIIGDNNVFEVGSYFEGSRIGNGCTIESKATITTGSTLGDNCVVGVRCSTFRDEVIPNNTVIFGSHQERRTQLPASKAQEILHTRHLQYLREVLPKYHSIKPVAAFTAK